VYVLGFVAVIDFLFFFVRPTTGKLVFFVGGPNIAAEEKCCRTEDLQVGFESGSNVLPAGNCAIGRFTRPTAPLQGSYHHPGGFWAFSWVRCGPHWQKGPAMPFNRGPPKRLSPSYNERPRQSSSIRKIVSLCHWIWPEKNVPALGDGVAPGTLDHTEAGTDGRHSGWFLVFIVTYHLAAHRRHFDDSNSQAPGEAGSSPKHRYARGVYVFKMIVSSP